MSKALLDQVRQLLTNERTAEAEALLRPFLAEFPADADANALQAEIELYTQRELQAAQRLPLLHEHSAGASLRQRLADYTLCRRLTAERFGFQTDSLLLALESELDAGGSWCASDGVGIGVSAVLIVKNEEQHLARCLESLRGFVDEIVVVDTGSTDRTLEIAREFGAKIGHFSWCNDFSAARNAALDLATQPWCLWIDADEGLRPGAEPLWREALMRPHFGGYGIQIVNYVERNGNRSEFVHAPVRLFRNHPKIRFSGKIHEQIAPSILDLGLKIAHLDRVRIDHWGYLPELMESRQKIERARNLLLKEIQENPNDAFHWFNLAMTENVAQDFYASAEAARRCCELLKPQTLIGCNAYHLWAMSLLHLNQVDHALEVIAEGESREFGSVLLQYEKIQAFLAKHEWHEAISAGEQCCAMSWPDRLTGDYTVLTQKRYEMYAKALLGGGKPEQALQVLNQAQDPEANVVLMAGILSAVGRSKEAITKLESAAKTQEQPVFRLLAAHHAFESGDFDTGVSLCRGLLSAPDLAEEAFSVWVQFAENLGRSDSLEEAFSAYAEVATPSADRWIQRGRFCQESGQLEKAITCFTEAFRLEPTNANALFNAGDAHYALGSYLDAAQCYEQALRLDSSHAQGWFVLGNCLFQMTALDGAALAYQTCLNLQPDHSAAKHNFSLIEEVRAGTIPA